MDEDEEVGTSPPSPQGGPTDTLYNLIHNHGEAVGRRGLPPVCPRGYAIYGEIWLSGWRQGAARAVPNAWTKSLLE